MKNFFQKNAFKLLIGVISITALSACSKSDDDAIVEGTISLRVVNAVEGSPDQDFYQNDRKLNTSAIAYGSASGSLMGASGYSRLAFTNTGTTTITAGADVGANANTSYTVFYHSRADGTKNLLGYEDDNTTAASGKAKVRFINFASLLSGAVNVTSATGSSVVSALAIRSSSAYLTLDPGVVFNVNMVGSLETTTIANTEFQAGKIYTVWFDSASATKVKYHVVVQN